MESDQGTGACDQDEKNVMAGTVWAREVRILANAMVWFSGGHCLSFFPARLCCLVLLTAALSVGQQSPGTDALPAAPSAVKDAQNPPEQQTPPSGETEERPSMMDKVKGLPSDVKVLPVKMKDLPIVWLIGPYVPHETMLTPLTMRERREVYLRQTYLNAGAYFARGFAAGIDQARTIPYEWGGGIGGYGKRYASHFGQFAIGNTLAAAGNAALGYEPRYDVCRCTKFWPRTRHAIVRNFVTYNETERELRPQIGLYGGTFAAGMIASTWKPGNNRSAWKDGMYASLEQAGYGVAVNWVREFALDILRKSGAQK